MKDRIRRLMDELQMTQQDFAAKLSISPASLSSIFTGRTNPTNNHVQAVHRAFPEVSVNWLLFGEGEMLVTADAALGGSPSDVRAEGEALPESPNAVEGADVVTSVGLSSRLRGSRDVSMRPTPLFVDKGTPAPARKVTEIRIFYSDGTYESFGPSAK
ncbi:MAG: helix-turn-helix transcriptional regulator [Alloprevotella sp.]|nr:helix-turn-helix transcriptional regulator [Alloprevotella sp.]